MKLVKEVQDENAPEPRKVKLLGRVISVNEVQQVNAYWFILVTLWGITTLSNDSKTATMYVNADEDKMSSSVTVTASGSEFYLIGYNVGTAEAPYQAVSGSVTLAPGQAVICMQ